MKTFRMKIRTNTTSCRTALHNETQKTQTRLIVSEGRKLRGLSARVNNCWSHSSVLWHIDTPDKHYVILLRQKENIMIKAGFIFFQRDKKTQSRKMQIQHWVLDGEQRKDKKETWIAYQNMKFISFIFVAEEVLYKQLYQEAPFFVCHQIKYQSISSKERIIKLCAV